MGDPGSVTPFRYRGQESDYTSLEGKFERLLKERTGERYETSAGVEALSFWNESWPEGASRIRMRRDDAIEAVKQDGTGDYVVTEDLVEVLEERYGLDLDPVQQEMISEEQERFIEEEWRDLIPDGFDLKRVKASEARRYIEDVGDFINLSEAPVVSFSEVYAPEADYQLSVSRKTDPVTGEVVETGAREPGVSLSEEIDRIAGEVDSINLADSGMFSGETLNEIGSEFESRGVEIEDVFLGIAPLDYRERSDYPIRSFRQFNIGPGVGEWIEARDFASGIEGRKTPSKQKELIPYSENPVEWMWVPEERSGKAVESMEEYGQRILEILDLENPEEVFGQNVELRD